MFCSRPVSISLDVLKRTHNYVWFFLVSCFNVTALNIQNKPVWFVWCKLCMFWFPWSPFVIHKIMVSSLWIEIHHFYRRYDTNFFHLFIEIISASRYFPDSFYSTMACSMHALNLPDKQKWTEFWLCRQKYFWKSHLNFEEIHLQQKVEHRLSNGGPVFKHWVLTKIIHYRHSQLNLQKLFCKAPLAFSIPQLLHCQTNRSNILLGYWHEMGGKWSYTYHQYCC